MNKTAKQLFNAFIEGYNQRDMKGLLSICTNDVNIWGTGLDEYRVGLKELEAQFLRDWSQSEKGYIKLVSMVPSKEDDLWAAGIGRVTLTIQGQEYTFDDFRTTIAVKNENGVTKISHAHSSFPDFRNPDNGSFPVK